MAEYEALKVELSSINTHLKDDNLQAVTQQDIDKYFDNFRSFFKLASAKIKQAQDENEKKQLLQEIRENNSLYSIQLKLKVDLDEDLNEIAYDFDSDKYPGDETLLHKIDSDQYAIMKS